jgi:hypothetical protein
VRPSLYAILGAALAVAAVLAARGIPAAPPAPATHPSHAGASPSPARLGALLLALPHDASLERATAEVQSLWGSEPLERTTLRTHMDQVRSLDIPVVLEMFHPARRDTCYLALLRIEGAEALLGGGTEGPLRVPLSDVDRLWTRQAVFLWRDHDAVAHAAESERAIAWVRQALARLGYLGADGDVAAAVARFQQHADLVPDGVAGSRTLLALYAALDYKRPRLAGSRS